MGLFSQICYKQAMQTQNELVQALTKMDSKPYPAYKAIKGRYQYQDYELLIDHVQGDPFAIPSKVRVRISIDTAGFPEDTYHNDCRNVALCDFLARRFYHSIRKYNTQREGSGKSGAIEIDRPGQEVLKTSSMVIIDGCIEARFLVGLPAFGRRIAGKIAARMFSEVIPQIVNNSLYFQKLPEEKLYRHVEVVEDAEFIRGKVIRIRSDRVCSGQRCASQGEWRRSPATLLGKTGPISKLPINEGKHDITQSRRDNRNGDPKRCYINCGWGLSWKINTLKRVGVRNLQPYP